MLVANKKNRQSCPATEKRDLRRQREFWSYLPSKNAMMKVKPIQHNYDEFGFIFEHKKFKLFTSK